MIRERRCAFCGTWSRWTRPSLAPRKCACGWPICCMMPTTEARWYHAQDALRGLRPVTVTISDLKRPPQTRFTSENGFSDTFSTDFNRFTA